MKTIRFTAYPDGYRCDQPGDQSGEYVKVIDVRELSEGMPMARFVLALSDALKEAECDLASENLGGNPVKIQHATGRVMGIQIAFNILREKLHGL